MTLSSGRQLWAYVGKIARIVEGAGINSVPQVWSSAGFVPLGVNEMDINDFVYSAMRSALVRGADNTSTPYIVDDRWTTVGKYIVYSERYVTWRNGSSVDPSILQTFNDRFEQHFASEPPNADNTYDFVRTYLNDQERVFNFEYEQDALELLDAFDAGVDLSQWRIAYERHARGLVSAYQL